MDEKNKEKVCYILPKYDVDDYQHFAHLPRFLNELGKNICLYVIIEKCKGKPDIRNATDIYPQKYSFDNRIKRMLELAIIIIKLRRKGYKKFFIRISVTAGLVTCLLSKFMDIKTYYWQSGQGKNVTPAWLSDVKGFFERVKYEVRLMPFYFILKLTDYFVTGPESMARYYEKQYRINSKKIITLYNDISVEHYQRMLESETKTKIRCELGLPFDYKIILFLHWLSPRKGANILVQLSLNISKVIENTIFMVVGEGPYKRQLEKEIYNRGLQKYFKIAGAIPNNKIYKYYGCADIFILPSIEEGFPRVLLETMAFGVPFVTFDVGGIKDIIDGIQKDCVVPMGDIEAFADRVVKMLNDHQLSKELRKTGLEQVEKFDTKKVTRMFIKRIVNT